MRRLTPFSLPFFKGGVSFRDRFEGFVDSLLFRIYLFGLVPVIAICALGINILYPKGYDYVHITEEQSQAVNEILEIPSRNYYMIWNRKSLVTLYRLRDCTINISCLLFLAHECLT